MSARVMSKEEMEKVLSTQMYGMLALTDGDKPYCIPLPFTYAKNAIYVGFFPRGRKWKYIQNNNNACFCTWEHGKSGRGYYSVIVEGKIVKVTDLAEIKLMLEASAMKRGRDAKWIEERVESIRARLKDPSEKGTTFKLAISEWGGRSRGPGTEAPPP